MRQLSVIQTVALLQAVAITAERVHGMDCSDITFADSQATGHLVHLALTPGGWPNISALAAHCLSCVPRWPLLPWLCACMRQSPPPACVPGLCPCLASCLPAHCLLASPAWHLRHLPVSSLPHRMSCSACSTGMMGALCISSARRLALRQQSDKSTPRHVESTLHHSVTQPQE